MKGEYFYFFLEFGVPEMSTPEGKIPVGTLESKILVIDKKAEVIKGRKIRSNISKIKTEFS